MIPVRRRLSRVLRFSPHWPNALTEVTVILGHLDEILASRAS